MPEKKRPRRVTPPITTPREQRLAERGDRKPTTLDDLMDALLEINSSLLALGERMSALEDALLEPLEGDER